MIPIQTQGIEPKYDSGLLRILACDVGVRVTGYAVMEGTTPLYTGNIINIKGRYTSTSVPDKLKHLISSLDIIYNKWSINDFVTSEPSGIQWKVPALDALEASLELWSQEREIKRHRYDSRSVRKFFTGRPNSSAIEMTHEVMLRSNLLGQQKSEKEWEAIAVGLYHFQIHNTR